MNELNNMNTLSQKIIRLVDGCQEAINKWGEKGGYRSKYEGCAHLLGYAVLLIAVGVAFETVVPEFVHHNILDYFELPVILKGFVKGFIIGSFLTGGVIMLMGVMLIILAGVVLLESAARRRKKGRG